MKYAEIYKLENDGTQKVTVTCSFDGDKVICKGDENFGEFLEQEGILDYSSSPPQKLFPKDGVRFLEQLRFNFKSGYLNASDVKER